MKLLGILAENLEKWPEKAKYYAQDSSGRAYPYTKKPVLHRKVENILWSSVGQLAGAGYLSCRLAADHATSIVTRADWEAERAKLKATKAGADGWARHRGRKMPVSEGTRVDVKHRDGCIYHCLPAGEGMAANWGHSKHPEDIMQYRLSAAKKQPSPKLERALTQAEEIRIMAHQADTMLAIRDLIRALDTQRAEVESTYQRQISEITQERETLVQKLAGEGLALVEVVVQPVEDMGDPANWKVGDVFVQVCGGSWNHQDGTLWTMLSDDGTDMKNYVSDSGSTKFVKDHALKFHSRPAT